MKTTETTASGFEIRRAADRGITRIGWLDSRHSFSFGAYHDPDRMGFRALRVINDDWIAPGAGFAEHPHRDMEIITWVLEGAVRHADDTGGGGVIRPGDVQAMTAGSGIRHSEFNASTTDRTHLLQVWIEPRQRGATPGYAQVSLDKGARRGRWQTLASDAGRAGGLPIAQDATVMVGDVAPSERLVHELAPERHAYLHVATGRVVADGATLDAGDALTISGPATLTITGATDDAQVMLFDLA
jgi:redox-sensitive bicupin YhaK (pirin superfamily)